MNFRSSLTKGILNQKNGLNILENIDKDIIKFADGSSLISVMSN
jgi:hypothetical protein